MADDPKHAWGSAISGTRLGATTHAIENVRFRNVRVTAEGGVAKVPDEPPEYAGQYPDPNLWGDLPAFGFYVRHAQGVTFTSCTTTAAHPDARKWLVASDVAKLETQ